MYGLNLFMTLLCKWLCWDAPRWEKPSQFHMNGNLSWLHTLWLSVSKGKTLFSQQKPILPSFCRHVIFQAASWGPSFSNENSFWLGRKKPKEAFSHSKFNCKCCSWKLSATLGPRPSFATSEKQWILQEAQIPYKLLVQDHRYLSDLKLLPFWSLHVVSMII